MKKKDVEKFFENDKKPNIPALLEDGTKSKCKSEIKGQEIGNKPDTNRTQTEHKPDTQTDTNQTQTEHKKHKPDTNRTQTKHTNGHTKNTNRTQTRHKPDTNESFSSLVGLQRQITILIFSLCKNSLTQITDELTIEYISETLKIRAGSIKTTIARLEKKKILQINNWKNGRAGWRKFKLPNHIYQEMLKLETGHKLNTNRTQIEHKPDTQTDTQTDTTIRSSSIYNIYNKTTTTDKPTEWNNITYETIEHIGFNETQVNQLWNKGNPLNDPTAIQQSINHLAFGLEHSEKTKSYGDKILTIFMGTLRKGEMWTESGYEPPHLKALRLYNEQQKKEEETLRKLQQETEELAYKKWLRTASDEVIKEILEKTKNVHFIPGARTGIVNHILKPIFLKEIYPKIKRGDNTCNKNN